MNMKRKAFTPKKESEGRKRTDSRRSTMKSHSSEYATRNPTNFEEAELRDSISKLVDSGILVSKKTKQNLDFLCINEGTSTDNTLQGQINSLSDITPEI